MSKDRRKDLRLVKPDEPVDPQRLEDETQALRAAVGDREELDAMDHEALLAMALGEDLAEIDEVEGRQATRLREALAGRGRDDLADLAGALRAAHQAGASLDATDDEAELEVILALSLGEEVVDLPAEEREAAAVLRGALERRDRRHPEAALAGALRAADGAAEIDAADAEALLALAGLDEAAQVDAAERRQAAGLASALEGDGDHPLRPLAVALRAADGRLPDLDDLRHQRALNGALDHHGARRQGRGVILGAIVALAAGVALFAGSMSWLETRSTGPTAAFPGASPIEARSTQELFDPAEPFPARGGESERMGRIVDARAADLRANRFAAWGVR